MTIPIKSKLFFAAATRSGAIIYIHPLQKIPAAMTTFPGRPVHYR